MTSAYSSLNRPAHPTFPSTSLLCRSQYLCVEKHYKMQIQAYSLPTYVHVLEEQEMHVLGSAATTFMSAKLIITRKV